MGTVGLPGNSATSYVILLNQALASLQAGNVQLAKTVLGLFAERVRTQSGKQLTPATAAGLLRTVNQVIAGAQAGYL